MRATIHQKNSIAIHLNGNNYNIHTFNTQNQEINIYAQIFIYLNIPIFRYSNIYENLQGAWEPVNVDAAARTSAQEIEVGSGEEKELFLASQVSNTNTLVLNPIYPSVFGSKFTRGGHICPPPTNNGGNG